MKINFEIISRLWFGTFNIKKFIKITRKRPTKEIIFVVIAELTKPLLEVIIRLFLKIIKPIYPTDPK